MTDMKVIGAGLGRTGTLALKLALEELGFSPCHHTVETIFHPERNHFYKEHLADESNDDVIKEFFAGYQATVDFPGAWFYEKFMEWNPDALVVLTVRDTPESYERSTQATTFSSNAASCWLTWKIDWTIRSLLSLPHINLQRAFFSRKLGVDPNHYKTDLTKFYTDWNTAVKRVVPAEKLLVFNVKEGWEPLCKFLGVKVPDTPFPRVNSSSQYSSYPSQVRYRNVRLVVMGTLVAFAIVLVGIAVCFGVNLLSAS